jgi:hypothetical protein
MGTLKKEEAKEVPHGIWQIVLSVVAVAMLFGSAIGVLLWLLYVLVERMRFPFVVFVLCAFCPVTTVYAQEEFTPKDKANIQALATAKLEFQSILPNGALDPTPWPGMWGRTVFHFTDVHTGVQRLSPLTTLLVRRGLCADTNARPCDILLRFEQSWKTPGDEHDPTAFRYAVRTPDGKQAEWLCLVQPGSKAHHWMHTKGTWHERKPGSDEYELEDRATSDLFDKITPSVPERPEKEQSPESPAPLELVAPFLRS